MKSYSSHKLESFLLPILGIVLCLVGWSIIAGKPVTTTTTKDDGWGDMITVTETTRVGLSKNLPSPSETWAASKPYLVEPFAKRGELDQGILRFSWLSLKLVAQGYAIALIIGTPIGFLLGLSKRFTLAFDPIIQILRPVSPLAWLPLGMVIFMGLRVNDAAGRVAFGTSDAAALFTIAILSLIHI